MTVELRVLGAFQLQVGGRVVALPRGSQRVVALLALRGRSSRSRIAGSLWPETHETRAMASLRTAIWKTNHVVPGFIRCSPSSADLAAEALVDCRRLVEVSRALLGAAEPAVSVPGARGDPWEVRDEALLPEWDDEWIDDDRERLRQIQVHVLEAQSERALRTGRYGMALEYALAASRMDPLRESAHRAIIRVHLAEGNVAEARRAFRRCSDLLGRELGLQPTRLTADLVWDPAPEGLAGPVDVSAAFLHTPAAAHPGGSS